MTEIINRAITAQVTNTSGNIRLDGSISIDPQTSKVKSYNLTAYVNTSLEAENPNFAFSGNINMESGFNIGLADPYKALAMPIMEVVQSIIADVEAEYNPVGE